MRQHKWMGYYEILETHQDPKIAGDRERELQKQYGYELDGSGHYVTSLYNSPWKNNKELASMAGSIGGVTGGFNAQQVVYVCEHCGTEMRGQNFFKYHHNRCKDKLAAHRS